MITVFTIRSFRIDRVVSLFSKLAFKFRKSQSYTQLNVISNEFLSGKTNECIVYFSSAHGVFQFLLCVDRRTKSSIVTRDEYTESAYFSKEEVQLNDIESGELLEEPGD